jgi:hypothetical protein
METRVCSSLAIRVRLGFGIDYSSEFEIQLFLVQITGMGIGWYKKWDREARAV